MTPFFSVIIPVYNSSDTVGKLTEDFLSQDFEDFELILIDDCSDDESGDICRAYAQKDRRILYIKNKENKGVSYTRNIGLDMAKGRYAVFADSDDNVKSTHLSSLYRCVSEAGENRLVITGIEYSTGYKNSAVGIDGAADKTSVFALYRDRLLSSPVNKAFRMDIIKKFFLKFDEKYRNGEDILFVLDYIEHIDGMYVKSNECTYIYNMGETGLHDMFSEREFETLRLIEKRLEKYIDKNGAEYMEFKEHMLKYFHWAIYRYAVSENKFSEKIQYIREFIKSEEYKNISRGVREKSGNSLYFKIALDFNSPVLAALYGTLKRLKNRYGGQK